MKNLVRRMALRMVLMAALPTLLAACGGGERSEIAERYAPINMEDAESMRINGFLWRAALDTLNFMPLASTDATGGVIITDWYANPRQPGERMKLTVEVMDRALRADALRVTAFRQEQQGGVWSDVPVQAGTAQKLEEAILKRARELRIATVTQ